MVRYPLRALLVLADLACLCLAFWLGWWTRFHVLPPLLVLSRYESPIAQPLKVSFMYNCLI